MYLGNDLLQDSIERIQKQYTKLYDMHDSYLNDSSPGYITDLLSPYVPTRNLRSSERHLLQVPHTSTHSYGERAFQVAAPTLWNSLPIHIRQSPTIHIFKKLLKIHLFVN